MKTTKIEMPEILSEDMLTAVESLMSDLKIKMDALSELKSVLKTSPTIQVDMVPPVILHGDAKVIKDYGNRGRSGLGKNHEIMRGGLLKQITDILRDASKPLTCREICATLRPMYGVTRKKDVKKLEASVSSMLGQYCYKLDKRFERVKNGRAFIYVLRNSNVNVK